MPDWRSAIRATFAERTFSSPAATLDSPQRRLWNPDGECGSRKRSVESDGSGLRRDLREFFCGPVAGDFAELHPDQVVEAAMEAGNDLLEDTEAVFLAVEVDPRPVADHDRRFAALDHVDHASGVQALGDELVGVAGRVAVPAAEPVARAADDRDDAARVGAVESRGVFDARGDASARR